MANHDRDEVEKVVKILKGAVTVGIALLTGAGVKMKNNKKEKTENEPNEWEFINIQSQLESLRGKPLGKFKYKDEIKALEKQEREYIERELKKGRK